MYSPQDRVYTTPDISVSAANAIVQKLRIESILRRCAYLTCANPCWPGPRLPARHVPEARQPTKHHRPHGGPGFDGYYDPRAAHNIFKPKKDIQRNTCNQRSGIPGAPFDDPYLQKPRETIAGGKYGGVLFSQYADKVDLRKPEFFKPFYPQKSPMRLPAIQREKTDANEIKGSQKVLEHTDITKHIDFSHKQKKNNLPKIDAKEKRRRKTLRKEKEFQEWERARNIYQAKLQLLRQESDHNILRRQERFHVLQTQDKEYENSQRRRIADEIKQGVRRKITFFKEVDKDATEIPAVDNVPIYRVKFELGQVSDKQQSGDGRKHKRKKKRHK